MVINSCILSFYKMKEESFIVFSYLAFLFYRILLADESSEEVKD